MKFYLHFYDKSNFAYQDTLLFDWEKPDSTLAELMENILQFMPQNKIISSIQKASFGQAINCLNMRVDSIFSNHDDIYIYWDKDPDYVSPSIRVKKPAAANKKFISANPNTTKTSTTTIKESTKPTPPTEKPVEIQKPEPLPPTQVISNIPAEYFETINKYTFYEANERTVRVILEIKNIHTHPKDKITTRFFDRSFELKIHGINGKNYVFAVPRLQCKIDPDKSSILVKENKININLRKADEKDNWFSLYRTKAIGDDDQLHKQLSLNIISINKYIVYNHYDKVICDHMYENYSIREISFIIVNSNNQ